MNFNVTKNNIKKVMLLVLVVSLFFSSCSTDEASKEDQSQEQSGIFSEMSYDELYHIIYEKAIF